MAEKIPERDETLYGGFSSIFKEEGKWTLWACKLPDDTVWRSNEPDAVIIIQHDNLRVLIEPLTRRHDTIQLLDNSKHVYTSTTRFQTPENAPISFRIQMDGKVIAKGANDLYNGFAVFGIHDSDGGLGFDFITNGIECGTVYSRHLPPRVTSKTAYYPRSFEIYDEQRLRHPTKGLHSFAISYQKERDYAEWLLDGEHVNSQDHIPDLIRTFQVDIGIMTAVDLGTEGSRSLQGQSIVGEWSPVRIDALPTRN